MLYNSGTNSIVADIDYWAGTDSVTYPIADKTRNANQALSSVVEKIMRASGRWQYDDTNYDNIPIATTDLVANQYGTSLDTAHVKIARVRIKDPQGKWRILQPIDRRELTEDQLNETGTPKWYDKLGVSLFFYPLNDYSYDGGIEAQFERDADYFETDSTTKAPGFASPFHRLVSLYAALDYTEPNELEARSRKIRARIEKMEAELVEFYSDRDRDDMPHMSTEGNREYAVGDVGYGAEPIRGPFPPLLIFMASLFETGIQGLADTKWSGVKGACAKLIGIDYRSKPGTFTAHQKLTKESSTTITELCKVPLPVSDGSNLWFSSESGKIWREVAGTYTLVYTIDPITDFDQHAAFNDAYPNLGLDATMWKTFGTDPVINFSSGCVLAPSGTEVPKVISRNLERATGSSTTVSCSIIVPSGSNMCVLAIAGTYDTGAGPYSVTGITFDGNAMSTINSGSGTSGGFKIAHSMRRYLNPSPGTFTVTATFQNAAVNRFIYVIVFEGVDQTTPSVANDSGFGDSSPALAALDLIGTADNQLLIMGTYSAISTHIMGPGQTEIINANEDPNPSTFFESVSMKPLKIGTAIVLGAAELTGLQNNVVDGFNPDDNEPDLSEEVNTVYFATSDILWKIPVDELASWSGNVTTVGQFENGNPDYHPMVVQNLQLFIGDGNLVAKVNELNQFIPETELNVERNEVITTMVGFDIDILIGTKDVNQCRVIRWDTVSESWSAEDEIDDTEVYAFIRDDNYVYALVGEAGRLYFYNGEKLIPYQRIPGVWNPSSTGKINANAVGFILGIPVFGFSNITGNPTEQGVYGFGSYSKDYPKTLSLDYPISTNETSGVQIGAIITRGSNMWVAWKSGTGVGVDKLDYTAKYTNARLETVVLSPMKDRSEFKTLVRAQAPYASLPANTAVVFGYDKNYSGSYTTLTSVVDAQHSIVKSDKTVPKIGNVQLRLGLTVSGNTAPEIEDFQVDIVAERSQTQ